MRATVSPSLVGREADLDALRDAYAESIAGSTRAVLVGGEAGIGKTRLVGEFLRSLPAEAIVLRGQSVDFDRDAPPYAPILSALRSLAQEVGEEALFDASGPARRRARPAAARAEHQRIHRRSARAGRRRPALRRRRRGARERRRRTARRAGDRRPPLGRSAEPGAAALPDQGHRRRTTADRAHLPQRRARPRQRPARIAARARPQSPRHAARTRPSRPPAGARDGDRDPRRAARRRRAGTGVPAHGGRALLRGGAGLLQRGAAASTASPTRSATSCSLATISSPSPPSAC